MIEVLIGLVVLAVALLSQVSSILGTHHVTRDMRAHSQATGLARRVLTEMQADEDWTGLYDRLANLRLAAAIGSGPRFNDGTRALSLATYAPGVEVPADLSDVGVLVLVPPRSTAPSHVQFWPALRENSNLPRFGLPADLNADAKITGGSRSDDYVVLPVLCRVRWTGSNGQSGETSVLTWLRGER